jgi:hypothetical protein
MGRVFVMGPPEKLAEDSLAAGCPTHIQDKKFQSAVGGIESQGSCVANTLFNVIAED